MSVRRAEDSRAAGQLGARAFHLDLYECLYRRDADGAPRYQEEDAIFLGDIEREADTLSCVTRALRDAFNFAEYAAVYAPLGIGRHVDHLLTRRAAEALCETAPVRLGFYEDLPYPCQGRDEHWRVELTAGLRPRLHLMDDAAWAAKLDAISLYRSQAGMLWKDGAEMVAQLQGYAREAGAGRRAERFWFSDAPGRSS